MNESTKQLESSSYLESSKKIAKQIFKAEVPEAVVQQLPDQTLYAVLKLNGVSSSTELIEILSTEQLRHLLDFDLWDRDQFYEDNFFEWLSVCDSAQELSLLQHVLSGLDFKLVAYLMVKYVETHIQTEATDEPPDIGYRSPDRGYTWLKIDIDDKDKEFLLGRLLAQIFEASAELFYQLVGVSQNTTLTELEEESFQDKIKRLSALGIPDIELAAEIHHVLNEDEISSKSNQPSRIDKDIVPAIGPLLYDADAIQPISTLLAELDSSVPWQEELTYVLNAAIVFWNVPFYESEHIDLLTQQVKGTINIGLELALANLEPDSAYEKFGLAGFYKRGLAQIYDLRKLAVKISDSQIAEFDPASIEFGLLAHLREPFPRVTKRFIEQGLNQNLELGKDIIEEPSAITQLATVRQLRDWLAKIN